MNSEYPRVKVRSQDDDDDRSRRLYLESLPGLQFPYLDDLDSLVSESEDESPPSVVRIPSSYIPRKTIPSSKIQVKNNNSNQKKSEECKQPNIRGSSSVPRPRAVLSSPDNDAMIGSSTKSLSYSSGMKHNLCQQDRHDDHQQQQLKLIPKLTETPIILSRKETTYPAPAPIMLSRKETTYPAPARIKTAGLMERKGRTVGTNPSGRARIKTAGSFPL